MNAQCRGRRAQPARWAALGLAALLGVLAVMTAGADATTFAQATVGATAVAPLPQTTATAIAQPVEVEPDSREAWALQDLARDQRWPDTVWRDTSGRLYVQHVDGQGSVRAIIRPFEFPAAALAAFFAEQEDAALAGYTIVTTNFHTFDAYRANRGGSGALVERRLHWQAGAWILGIEGEISGGGEQELDALGVRLIDAGGRYGLPVPPGGVLRTPTVRPGASTPTAQTCTDFVDVPPGHWAYQYVRNLACRNVVTGYGDGTYRPQARVTRGQLVKMVVLAEGFTLAVPAEPTFADVPGSHTFYAYVETAAARNIVDGYNGGRFRPDEYVTRAQIAKIIVRAKRWPLVRGAGSPFCDVAREHWAYDFVQTARYFRAMSGYTNGCFSPDARATRAQVAKVLAADP